ncbi:MAG: helix-turn-helix transcriptional regulator [bacterium]
MLEPTKKRTTTGYVEIRFRIPVKNLDKVKKAMADYGAEEAADSTPWREVCPDFNASLALQGARHRESLTQKELARLIGISQTHISEMEHGKRPIGKEMAKRLAKALHVDYRVFL